MPSPRLSAERSRAQPSPPGDLHISLGPGSFPRPAGPNTRGSAAPGLRQTNAARSQRAPRPVRAAAGPAGPAPGRGTAVAAAAGRAAGPWAVTPAPRPACGGGARRAGPGRWGSSHYFTVNL